MKFFTATAVLATAININQAGAFSPSIFSCTAPASITSAAHSSSSSLLKNVKDDATLEKYQALEFGARKNEYMGLFDLENQQILCDMEEDAIILATAESLLAPIMSDVHKLKTKLERANGNSENDQSVKKLVAAVAMHTETTFNDLLGSGSLVEASVKKKMLCILGAELLPFHEMSDFMWRCVHKPEGYAGDYITIDMIYDSKASGSGNIGCLLDRYALDFVAAQAVKNRRSMIADKIKTLLSERSSNDSPLEVTSMACGPARELQDVFQDSTDHLQPNINLNLIDLDGGALTLVRNWIDDVENFPHDRVSLHQKNLFYLARGRESIDIEPQDFMYSMGLIDYFKDKYIILLLDYVFDMLKEGGKVALGNFHVCNPTRGWMEIVEWNLIHRDEEQMKDLFLKSKFASPCDIIYDDTGVQMMAVCEKKLAKGKSGSLLPPPPL